MISMAFLAALLASAAPAPPPASGPSASAQPAIQGDTEKKVCRRVVITGSITARRICHTQQEWNAMAASDEDNVRRLQDRPGKGMDPTN